MPVSSQVNSAPSKDDYRKNIIVFGECGVGKSSLINLIAGEKICQTSSGALGCTLEYQQHSVDLGNQHFSIWDTAGLDEGSQGSVPAEKAEVYLKRLLHELAKNDGIDLLVYCVRGTRVRSALLTNYHIFYSAICRKRVPIAVVITGLENQEGDMETWWRTNKRQLSSLRMHFDGHACVTTLESSAVDDGMLQQRREVSKAAVIDMITSTCRTQHWKPQAERSWIDSAYSDIRAMLSPREGSSTRPSTIIMCEASRNRHPTWFVRKRSISFHNPLTFSLSLNPVTFRNPVSISNDRSQCKLPFEDSLKCTPERLYRVYQVPRKELPHEGTDAESKIDTMVKRGADLLLFSVKMEGAEPGTVKSQWEHFNFTYGGDLSPQIVVVTGALDQNTAEEWWKDVVGCRTLCKNDIDVVYWPVDGAAMTELEAARKHLQWLVNERCIDCSLNDTLTRNGNLFRRSLLLDMTALWIKPENHGKEDVSTSCEEDHDMLTKWGIWWDHSPQGTPSSPIEPWQGWPY